MLKQIKDLGIEKTIPDNTDIIPFQQADGISGHITRANFLSNLQTYPTSFSHWHDESIIEQGNSLRTDIVTSLTYGIETYQDPPAINDSFSFYRLLAAGNYRISILTCRKSNLGKLKLEINGVLAFNDLDCYNASIISNATLTRDVVIATSGLQKFKWTVYTKNASASTYYFSGRKFWGIKI